MKHRKTPGWVRAATSGQRTMRLPGAIVLSGLEGPLELECTRCARRGRYQVDGLIEQHGDISVRGAMLQIAAKAGCKLALSPPAVTDMDYADKCCKVRHIGGEGDLA